MSTAEFQMKHFVASDFDIKHKTLSNFDIKYYAPSISINCIYFENLRDIEFRHSTSHVIEFEYDTFRTSGFRIEIKSMIEFRFEEI